MTSYPGRKVQTLKEFAHALLENRLAQMTCRLILTLVQSSQFSRPIQLLIKVDKTHGSAPSGQSGMDNFRGSNIR